LFGLKTKITVEGRIAVAGDNGGHKSSHGKRKGTKRVMLDR